MNILGNDRIPPDGKPTVIKGGKRYQGEDPERHGGLQHLTETYSEDGDW